MVQLSRRATLDAGPPLARCPSHLPVRAALVPAGRVDRRSGGVPSETLKYDATRISVHVTSSRNRRDCKVGRVAEAYGLTGIDEDLVDRRTGASGEGWSLRDLADYFNQSVLRRALEDADTTPLEGEVENIYRLLTDDDVSEGMRVRTGKRLEREGVDFEDVEGSFVSHPTMGRHLRDCLGVESSRSKGRGDPTEAARERIFKMLTRAERVVENTFDGLAAGGHVTAGSLAVTVDVRVTCEDCGVHGDVSSFLARGGCDCDDD